MLHYNDQVRLPLFMFWGKLKWFNYSTDMAAVLGDEVTIWNDEIYETDSMTMLATRESEVLYSHNFGLSVV
jgi:hypothetical protein